LVLQLHGREADDLHRSMAAWKRGGVGLHDRLVRAMVKKRLRASFQSASSSQIRGLANMAPETTPPVLPN
jgi:hypothetical protein